MRRGSAAVQEPQDTVADGLRAELAEMGARHELELAAAYAARDRAEHAAKVARDAVVDTAAEVADMHVTALANFSDYHPGFDEPIPDDARVTKAGKCIGTWPPVRGDRASDWPAVEAVDFGAVYALIGAELAGVGA